MSRETIKDRYKTASGMGAGLVEFAQSYGLDIKPECRALDIDPAVFDDLTGRISLDRFCRLLERCAALTGDETFGLKFAQKYKSGSTGPYGYGLMTAPTFEDFLKFQQEHMQYITRTTCSSLTMDSQFATFTWSFSPAIFNRAQYVDLGLALVFRHMRNIIGSAITDIEVGLERSAPADTAAHKSIFGSGVTFDNRTNNLHIPVDLLNIANPKADARLFKLMDLQCFDYRPSMNENSDFLDEMKDFIFARLSEDDISLATASHYFNLSERTLQRRLSELNTTLNDLRDEARRELASRMLAETALSATEICYRLGYSAPSAFTRSFQRWFGISPKEFRKHATGPVNP